MLKILNHGSNVGVSLQKIIKQKKKKSCHFSTIFFQTYIIKQISYFSFFLSFYWLLSPLLILKYTWGVANLKSTRILKDLNLRQRDLSQTEDYYDLQSEYLIYSTVPTKKSFKTQEIYN